MNRLIAAFALFAASPAFAAPEPACPAKTPSGLGYQLVTPGDGAQPGDSDIVSVAYRGTLAADGSEFDRSDSAEFPVNGVIPGFGEGLKLMKPGARIRLCIPSVLGYGARGAGRIPPNADLVFTVELKSVRAEPRPEPLSVAERTCGQRSASGLGYTILLPGIGSGPADDNIALINYSGYLAADGRPFDAGQSVPLPVGQMVTGFREGLKLTARGGKSRLCIPAALGYGAAGAGPIPPNADLVFVIDVLDFKTPAELAELEKQMRAGDAR